MIERVARAMLSNNPSPGALTWDDYPASVHAATLRTARAAIEAMREPTEDMQDAGAYPRENKKPVADIWQAMVGKALEE
jgi:hypothetical protein